MRPRHAPVFFAIVAVFFTLLAPPLRAQTDPKAAEATRLMRNGLTSANRRQFLLSGLLVCGCCGGAYTIIGKDRYGCATRRMKQTCANGTTISRQKLEARVLTGLKERLCAPDLIHAFVTAYRHEVESRQAGRSFRRGPRVGAWMLRCMASWRRSWP